MEEIVQVKALENFVKDRGITTLIHFTRVENLSSILSNGLLPVETLSNESICYVNNDIHRFDNCLDANCLSIQFPNYQMFYKYRDRDWQVDWVVLGIKKEVLWKKDCVFCIENAASGNMLSTSLNERRGLRALERLFDEYPGKPTRDTLGLKRNIPTHPQAEVLVFDVIEPELIWGVAFESQEKLNKYNSLIPANVRVEVHPRLYSYRKDYEYWRI